MIFYVHGFNSGKESTTGKLLQAQIGRPVCRVGYDCAKPFKDNLAKLEDQVWDGSDGFDVIVGTSLGGFYAVELVKSLQTCAVVFNPAMRPKSQLRMFLGLNVNFATGERWVFEPSILDTYPEELKAPKGLPCMAFASKADELLPGNALLAEKEFEAFKFIEGGHRIVDFSKYLDTIVHYENVLGVSPEE
jgi:predicted esterase YcpF (UPF0227 family)